MFEEDGPSSPYLTAARPFVPNAIACRNERTNSYEEHTDGGVGLANQSWPGVGIGGGHFYVRFQSDPTGGGSLSSLHGPEKRS